jgi:hypothetical protein
VNERITVTVLSVALAAVTTGLVVYAMRALAAVSDAAAQLGNLPPP